MVNLKPIVWREVEEKLKSMKWLEIDYIKQHSRIDYDCEDALLELYAESAEEMVLNTLGRTYEDLLENFGIDQPDGSKHVPAAIVQASLMLVDSSYTNRSPISPTNMYQVPYTYDFLVKPYMKLTTNDNKE
jgi:uncharacterized phage protein (predicted DNA packaging)